MINVLKLVKSMCTLIWTCSRRFFRCSIARSTNCRSATFRQGRILGDRVLPPPARSLPAGFSSTKFCLRLWNSLKVSNSFKPRMFWQPFGKQSSRGFISCTSRNAQSCCSVKPVPAIAYIVHKKIFSMHEKSRLIFGNALGRRAALQNKRALLSGGETLPKQKGPRSMAGGQHVEGLFAHSWAKRGVWGPPCFWLR